MLKFYNTMPYAFLVISESSDIVIIEIDNKEMAGRSETDIEREKREKVCQAAEKRRSVQLQPPFKYKI